MNLSVNSSAGTIGRRITNDLISGVPSGYTFVYAYPINVNNSMYISHATFNYHGSLYFNLYAATSSAYAEDIKVGIIFAKI